MRTSNKKEMNTTKQLLLGLAVLAIASSSLCNKTHGDYARGVTADGEEVRFWIDREHSYPSGWHVGGSLIDRHFSTYPEVKEIIIPSFLRKLAILDLSGLHSLTNIVMPPGMVSLKKSG